MRGGVVWGGVCVCAVWWTVGVAAGMDGNVGGWECGMRSVLVSCWGREIWSVLM